MPGLPRHFLPHFAGFQCARITASKQREAAWNTCILSVGNSFILIDGRRGKLLATSWGKCLLGGPQGEREADGVGVSQQFTPAGAAETKEPIFHLACSPPLSSNERNETHHCPAHVERSFKVALRLCQG